MTPVLCYGLLWDELSSSRGRAVTVLEAIFTGVVHVTVDELDWNLRFWLKEKDTMTHIKQGRVVVVTTHPRDKRRGRRRKTMPFFLAVCGEKDAWEKRRTWWPLDRGETIGNIIFYVFVLK